MKDDTAARDFVRPSERLRGIAVAWNDAQGFGMIREAGGGRFFSASRHDVEKDNIGRAFLIPGEPVELVAGGYCSGKPTARDVRPAFREKIEDPAAWRERARVCKNTSFARRPFGGFLFLIPADAKKFLPGDTVLVGVRRPNPGKRNWVAVNPTLVAVDEGKPRPPRRKARS